MRVKILLAFMLTTSLLVPITAQKQQQPPKQQDDVVRTDINLVQIDVVVTDKAGRQVTNLTPEDFEVAEDGKKRQVTHFSYIATGTPSSDTAPNPEQPRKPGEREPVKPARLKREQVRRTVALVIDDLGLSYESFGFARKALAKFVDEQMQPNDMVAILRTSAGVGVLQQFTSDKRQLYAFIERVRWNQVGRGGLNPGGSMNEASVGADNRDSIQFTEEMEESRAGMYSVGTMGTISSIVKGMGDMPGRKSIVLISEAFELTNAEGRNTRLIQEMRRITDEANANSVTIYTVDASGLQTNAFTASDTVMGYHSIPNLSPTGTSTNPPPRTLPRVDTMTQRSEQGTSAPFSRLGTLAGMRESQLGETQTVLSYLAQRTGGIFEHNRNDLGRSVERMMKDQQGYYLIGYRPDESTIGANASKRMHTLKVRVKRSGVKVRSRAGYFGVKTESDAQRPRTRLEQLKAALTSPFASGDINIQLTSLFGDEPNGGGSYMRSLLHIDAKDLQFTKASDGTRTADLEMVAVAFGESGQIVNQITYPQIVYAATDADYQRMLDNGLVYILNVPLKKGGPYQMRVAVRDGTSERTGAAMQFVEAPELTNNRLALSGIVLSSAAEAAKSKAIEQENKSGPAVRHLRQGTMIDYRFLIYNAQVSGTGPVQMQMRLLREGKTVFTGKVVPVDLSKESNPKRINTGGRLRLGSDLTPGDYVLHVAVKDVTNPKKPRIASQWIDFQIVN